MASLLPVVASASASAAPDQTGSRDQLAALTAKVNAEAVRIHQLTEQLDQARLQVNSTSARLAAVTAQHQTTVNRLGANRAILLQQALRAYMHGGVAEGTATDASGGSADLTLGREYLRVASGDVADTGDRLRQVDASLQVDLALLRGAQQANLTATVQLQALRTNALTVASTTQAQLDSLEGQIAAQTQVQAAAAAVSKTAPPPPKTQGLPVNNGLATVIQQAVGLPVATPVATSPTASGAASSASSAATGANAASSGGGHAGGVWLALRRCESSDNYAENTGNGFYGAYQFSPSTWTGLGFPGRPDLESPAMQDEAAMKLQAQAGWGQWPACSAALGLA